MKLQKNWFQRARIEAIETLSFWKGMINSRDIMQRFGVSRVIANRDLNHYLGIAPGNLVYSPSKKVYEATSIFNPVLDKTGIEEYLQLEGSSGGAIDQGLIEKIKMPDSVLKPEYIRVVLEAIELQNGLRLKYRSLNHPNGQDRLLYPHSVVFSGFRWHIRAWCATHNSFRDFNLSRISSVPGLTGDWVEEATSDNDKDWNKRITVKLSTNPKLSRLEKSLIEAEFGIVRKYLEIETRAALIPYVLQAYQVDWEEENRNPRKNRLVIANRSMLAPYLWGN